MTLEPIDIAAIFFFSGTIFFGIGSILNLRIWLLGSENPIRTILRTIIVILNPKTWLKIINVFISKIFGQERLYTIDRVRGIEKASFITFYVLLILANHIAADIAMGVSSIQEFIIEFFRSPFFPGEIFGVLGTELSIQWKLFLLIDNLSMAIVLFFAEGLAIYRRFVKKHFLFGSREDAIGLFLPVIWFIFRYLAEAATIIQYGFPPASKYMFIAYGIAQVLSVFPLNIEMMYNLLWPTSGLFLGIFFGAIPYTGRLWHAFAGPITLLINNLEARGD